VSGPCSRPLAEAAPQTRCMRAQQQAVWRLRRTRKRTKRDGCPLRGGGRCDHLDTKRGRKLQDCSLYRASQCASPWAPRATSSVPSPSQTGRRCVGGYRLCLLFCLLLSSALLTSVCLCSRRPRGCRSCDGTARHVHRPVHGEGVHHGLSTPFATGSVRPSSQLCQKQCRDENGFKCHTTSEGHLRQVSVFNHLWGGGRRPQQNSDPCCCSPDVHLWTEREQGGG
jgi:hypothetical protein